MRRVSLILVPLLLLVACTPAQPTLSPAQIGTAAAATIAALSTARPVASATPTPTREALSTEAPPAATAAKGSVLAYVGAGGNLYAWTAESGSRALTGDGGAQYPSISSDGQWIAYVQAQAEPRSYSLWVVSADGGNQRQVFGPQDFSRLIDDPYAVAVTVEQMAWVPGSHTLAFSTQPVYDGPGQLLNDDLWLVEAESGAAHRLLDKKQGGMFYFSPDGSRVALVKPDRINLMNADGSDRRENVFTYEKVLTYSEYQYHVRPLWSPDGSRLWVAAPPRDPLAQPAQPTTVWSIPTDGGAPAQVLSVVTPFLMEPELSPDLQWVAYLKPEQVGLEVQNDLHILALEGGEDTLYRTNIQAFSSWATDSKRFAYVATNPVRVELGEVGGSSRPLDESIQPTRLQWLDGESYIYLVSMKEREEFYLGKVGGEGLKIAEYAPGASDTPMWAAR